MNQLRIEFSDVIFCEINVIAARHRKHIQNPVKHLRWRIPLSVFTKSSIFDVLLVLNMSLIWQGFFVLLSIETTTSNLPRPANLSIVISILFEQQSQAEIYSLGELQEIYSLLIKLQACSNLTMRNQNDIDRVVLFFLLLTWDFLKCASTNSTWIMIIKLIPLRKKDIEQ